MCREGIVNKAQHANILNICTKASTSNVGKTSKTPAKTQDMHQRLNRQRSSIIEQPRQLKVGRRIRSRRTRRTRITICMTLVVRYMRHIARPLIACLRKVRIVVLNCRLLASPDPPRDEGERAEEDGAANTADDATDYLFAAGG